MDELDNSVLHHGLPSESRTRRRPWAPHQARASHPASRLWVNFALCAFIVSGCRAGTHHDYPRPSANSPDTDVQNPRTAADETLVETDGSTGVLPLRVSSARRVLVDPSERPVFYLADTAWALFYSMTPAEQTEYFTLRAGQRFKAIHAILVLGDLNRPDLAGRSSLVVQQPEEVGIERWRPLTPNEAFFDEVEATIERASQVGLILGLLPIWAASHANGERPLLDEAAAQSYGCFLGRRFREHVVIWVLGGDYLVVDTERDRTELWRTMARSIRECGGEQLMTFHPITARSSSLWFHHDDWLAFNMIQSGHTRDRIPPTGVDLIRNDYALIPAKPTIDGESVYEGIANRLDPDANDILTDRDVRAAAWRSVLSGAFGYVYGANGLMQGVRDRSERWAARHRAPTWPEALAFPGGGQLAVLARLFDDIGPFEPAPAHLARAVEPGVASPVAGFGKGGSLLVVYARKGDTFMIPRATCNSSTGRATWLDPRTGRRLDALGHESTDAVAFDPPDKQDWTLVVQCGPASIGTF